MGIVALGLRTGAHSSSHCLLSSPTCAPGSCEVNLRIKQGGKSSLIFRSSVEGRVGQGGAVTPRKGRPCSVGARQAPVLAFSVCTSLPFLRSCGGAGKRRASLRRLSDWLPASGDGCVSSPGGEGRSGHCSNHCHSRSRRSLGRRARVRAAASQARGRGPGRRALGSRAGAMPGRRVIAVPACRRPDSTRSLAQESSFRCTQLPRSAAARNHALV